MSNDDIGNQIRTCYADVACSFDPKGYIVDKLYQERIITLRQKADINKIEAEDTRADRLLHMLFEGRHPKRFVVFRESLMKDYDWLVEIIDACKRDAKQFANKSTGKKLKVVKKSDVLKKSTVVKKSSAKNLPAKELTAKVCSSGKSMKRTINQTISQNIAESSAGPPNRKHSRQEKQTEEETNGECSNGVNKHRTVRAQNYQLRDLGIFAKKKKKRRTPDIIATLVKVGNSIEYKSRKYYFETYFDDGSCPPVRAPVYKKKLRKKFAKLKGKQVKLEGGKYGAKIPVQIRSKNSFEIQYYDDYIPVPLDADN